MFLMNRGEGEKEEAVNKRLAFGGQGGCPLCGRAGTEGGVAVEAAFFSEIS